MIWGVYVKPAWRGRGVGRAMLDVCAEWGREQGVLSVHLAVVTTNPDAIRCYAGCGFETFGLQPQVIRAHGRLYDMLLMVKRL
jgi:ribosomal protein S18 acetylase RimI-like enzyme